MFDSLVFSNMLHRPARTAVSVLGIAVGVLLIVFTVGLSNGTMRERGRREGNVGAEIMFRASGTIGLSGTESFRLPIDLLESVKKIEGVQTAIAIGQATVSSDDNNTGSRLVDGVNYDEYADVVGISTREGRKPNDRADEAVIDTGWQQQKKFKVGDKLRLYERDFTIVGTYEPAAGARLNASSARRGGQGDCIFGQGKKWRRSKIRRGKPAQQLPRQPDRNDERARGALHAGHTGSQRLP
jgi:putative ABC transport system permease protein